MAIKFIYFVLFTIISISVLNGQECSSKKKFTLERCSQSSDCYGSEDGSRFCAGRNSKDEFKDCPDPNNDVKVCTCYPRTIKYCKAHADCRDEEYCGKSPRTGNQICTGCLSYSDAAINIKTIGKTNRCENTVKRKEHPPCGSALDYCSPTLPCSKPYECLYFGGSQYFECSDNMPCQCVIPSIVKKSGKIAKVGIQECKTNRDCKNSREICVLDTIENKKACVSCDTVNSNVFYTLLSQQSFDDKCSKLPVKRSPPTNYYLSANGRTFDLCTSDVQCTGSRKCVQFKDFSDPSKTTPCKGDDELCFCKRPSLKKCRNFSNCPVGESCLTSGNIGANANCVSNSFINTVSARNYEIIGNNQPKPNPRNGRSLTGDKCRFDWDCKDGNQRRCTHISEKWGGCAGREACVCQPLQTTECKSNTDCKTNGEECVKYVDGKTDGFCISTQVKNARSDIQSINFSSTKPKAVPYGTGLTGDPCLVWNDCQQDSGRTCRHQNENKSFCRGRNFCRCTIRDQSKNKCKSSQDCRDGEICVTYHGSFPMNPTCMSQEAFNKDETKFLKEVNLKSLRRNLIANTRALDSKNTESQVNSFQDYIDRRTSYLTNRFASRGIVDVHNNIKSLEV